MPGLVVAIPVAVGQEVKTGETVAIIEAMKIQNILKAERDGVVKAVSGSAGRLHLAAEGHQLFLQRVERPRVADTVLFVEGGDGSARMLLDYHFDV